MTKAVDFSKTDSKLLINHTMSLPRESHFHFLAVGNIKFLNMKHSNFSQRRIFKLRASILGHHVDVETDVSVYRTCNLKMKATFSPKQNISCIRLHD